MYYGQQVIFFSKKNHPMSGSISSLDYCNLQSKSLYLFTNTSCIKQRRRLQIQSAGLGYHALTCSFKNDSKYTF